jgi:hypothetical protein
MSQRFRNVIGARRVTNPLVASAWIMALVVLTIVTSTNQVLADNYFFFIAHDASPWVVAGMWFVLVAIGLALLTGFFWAVNRFGHRTFDIIATGTTLLAAIILVGSIIGLAGPVFSWRPFVSGPVLWASLLTISLALALVIGLIVKRSLNGSKLVKSSDSAERTKKPQPILLLVAGIAVMWLLFLAFLQANSTIADLQPFGQPLGSFVFTLIIAVGFAYLARRLAGGIAALVISLVVAALPLATASALPLETSIPPRIVFDESGSRPDVLWIIVDELQYSAVFDSNGKVRDIFPNMAALQEQSTTYTEAFTTADSTSIAVPAMLNGRADINGLSEAELRAMQESSGVLAWLGSRYSITPLSPLFNQDSVETASPNQSLTVFEQPQGTWESLKLLVADTVAVAGRTTLHPWIAEVFPSTQGRWSHYWRDPDSSMDAFGANSFQALPERPSPLLALWHYMGVHIPLSVDMDGEKLGLASRGFTSPGADPDGFFPLSEHLAELHRRLYLAEVIEFDRQLGNVMSLWQLREAGNSSVVILTSDHGRTFSLDTDYFRSGSLQERWTETAHVPLMVRYPGQNVPKKVHDIVSTGQIAATVLNAVGVESLVGVELSPPLGEPLPESPLLLHWDSQEADVWFKDGIHRRENPWLESTIASAKSDEPFFVGYGEALLGDRVSEGFTRVSPNEVEEWKGESPYVVVQLQVPDALCPSRLPGLVTEDSRIVGTILWETNANPEQGWALWRGADASTAEFWCAVKN